MIRFNCPNCGREYEVPSALAHLPLLCKKCGQRIPVPDAPPSPPPPPARKPAPKPVASPPPPPAPAPPPPTLAPAAREPVAPPTPPLEEAPVAPPSVSEKQSDERPFLTPESIAALESRTEKSARPQLAPAKSGGGRKFVGWVVDAAVALALIAAGAFLGEILAEKSTLDVWRDAGSSVTFPPIDLLMWLAPPVLFTLVYVLLISRGKSVGARLGKAG